MTIFNRSRYAKISTRKIDNNNNNNNDNDNDNGNDNDNNNNDNDNNIIIRILYFKLTVKKKSIVNATFTRRLDI